ncbi:MAG: alpha/beta hydrolase [Pseudomonadales bacterium]
MEALLRVITLLAAAYAVLCVFLYLVQDRLIFYPAGVWREPQGPHVQPVSLERENGALNGWVVNADAEGPVLVYFGGNAEELSGLVDVFAGLDSTTLLMNYRGYGRSAGKPSTSAFVEDARAVVEVLARRYASDRPLVLFGRSLGTGIAASVAQSVRVDGVILMSPFRSLTHLGERLMPWLPVRLLLRHELDVLASLDSLPDRTLVLYSPEDRIVPAAESKALLRLFPRTPRVVEFDGGHNVPLTHPEVWREVADFLGSSWASR